MRKTLCFVVKRGEGWSWKTGNNYSEIFRTRAEASAAATQNAHENFSKGILLQVMAQDDDGSWSLR